MTRPVVPIAGGSRGIHEAGRLARITPLLPMGRPGGPNEIAEAVLFLLSDTASDISGAVLNISGSR